MYLSASPVAAAEFGNASTSAPLAAITSLPTPPAPAPNAAPRSPIPNSSRNDCQPNPASGSLTVTLLNTGDASLPPGGTLNLYATTTRGVLASSSTLLASIKLAKTLRPGATATLTLPVSTDDLPPGSYHLLATVATTRHHITPIASTTDPFTIKPKTPNPIHGWPFAF